MQVDAGEVLKTLDPTLRLMSESEAIGAEDDNKIEGERRYIASLLDEAHIKYSEEGDDYIVRGYDVVEACEALDLGDEQCDSFSGDTAYLNLFDSIGMVWATLTLKINTDRIGYLVSWLVEK
jgi:hypothetical protein